MINPFAKLDLKNDYVETFSTPHGKRVLNHILKVSGVTLPRISLDIEQTRINEGERRLAYSIYAQVHGSQDLLLEQLREQLASQERQQT